MLSILCTEQHLRIVLDLTSLKGTRRFKQALHVILLLDQ